MDSKSVNYRKIGIFLITAILIIGIVAYFIVPVKADSFVSVQTHDIFGYMGENELESYISPELRLSYLMNYPSSDYGNMMCVTSTSGTSYYDATLYYDFEAFSFPYGYSVDHAIVTSSIDWLISGQTGVFGTSSIVFELIDETANEIVGQTTFSFTNNTSLSGSLTFSNLLYADEYYSHTYSYRVILHLRWAVNGNYATLYLYDCLSSQRLIVNGSTVPPYTNPPTPTPTPVFTPTPTPTPSPVPEYTPAFVDGLVTSVPTLPPFIIDYGEDFGSIDSINRSVGAFIQNAFNLPYVTHFPDHPDVAVKDGTLIEHLPWFPVIRRALFAGTLGLVAGVVTTTIIEGRNRDNRGKRGK